MPSGFIASSGTARKCRPVARRTSRALNRAGESGVLSARCCILSSRKLGVRIGEPAHYIKEATQLSLRQDQAGCRLGAGPRPTVVVRAFAVQHLSDAVQNSALRNFPLRRLVVARLLAPGTLVGLGARANAGLQVSVSMNVITPSLTLTPPFCANICVPAQDAVMRLLLLVVFFSYVSVFMWFCLFSCALFYLMRAPLG